MDCSLHWVPLLYWWQLYKLRTSLSTIIQFHELRTSLSTIILLMQFHELQTSLSTINLLIQFHEIADHWVPLLYWYSSMKLKTSLRPILYWYRSMKLKTSLSTNTLLVTVPWTAAFTAYHYFTGDSFMNCGLHWVPLTLLIQFHDTADFTEYHYFTNTVPWNCRLHNALRLGLREFISVQELQTSYESLWTSTWLRRLTWLHRHRTSLLSLGTVYSNTENWQCEPENCSAAFSAWTFRDTRKLLRVSYFSTLSIWCLSVS